MTSKISSTVPDWEIVTVREVNARKEVVFEVWSNPDHLKNWWGPKGFTNTFEKFEFRAGGKWKFIMHGPDKGNYDNECIFLEIIPYSLITWDRVTKPSFKAVVTFNEVTQTSPW